ncbi:MAG: YicC family protein [Lachnospiraceae bacterium]|nr:YicC family protein [Lachnospiraceae bacterium]
MLKSMTGFGRHEKVTGDYKMVVELKSVNHRYCDMSVKMPKKFSFFETGIRNLLKEYISRGKVDVFITYEDYTENKECVKYNADIAKGYMDCLMQMSKDFSLDMDVRISGLSRYPDVITLEEQTIDEKEIWSVFEEVIKKAAENFVESRITEGEKLKIDIMNKLDTMLEYVAKIEERSPQIVEEYRQKIINKVNELLGDTKIDESVLATEIIVFADKICVDEETVRLRSHISNMKDTLNLAENIGRKLDFIAQEMNRESNTILSKANDIEVSNIAIDLKTEVEKIREQIQNIE